MNDSDLSLVFDNLDAFMPPSQRSKRDGSQQRQHLSQVGAADLENIILMPVEMPSEELIAQNFHEISSI